MRPAVRRLIWIAGAILGVLVLAVLALPYLVSLDALRERVVEKAAAALHRKVEVGKVRLQILTGLGAGVEKVVVHNQQGWESPALLTADEVSVKVAFWPLLSRRVEVKKIVLHGLALTVERDPAGKLNVGDFISAGGRESASAAETAATALLVSRIEIAGGRALFADRKVSPGKTVTTGIEDLQGRIADMRHPAADGDVPVCHVTHFNALFWDCGAAPTRVIEHGIVDPGRRYTGELERVGVVINEARRRGRVTGTDLLERFKRLGIPIDLFGMDAAALGGIEDLPQDRLHDELARRRCYLHPIRWTSLGLSLIEAMHLGMPVVALATTEAVEAVPRAAGVVSTRIDVLADAARTFLRDPDAARRAGTAARAYALERFGLERFLADWDELLWEVISRAPRAGVRAR